MKRSELLRKLRKAAKAAGLEYEQFEMTKHTAVTIGGSRSTIPRHAEIADRLAEVICKQLEPTLGKGWWR